MVFSEPVTDFATGDVTLGGTAGATTAIVTGSGTTYDVAVSGMTTGGTVIATIGGRQGPRRGRQRQQRLHHHRQHRHMGATQRRQRLGSREREHDGQSDRRRAERHDSRRRLDLVDPEDRPAAGTWHDDERDDRPGRHGERLPRAERAAPAQAISYTPATDYVGPDGFDYTITDGQWQLLDGARLHQRRSSTGSLDSQMILEDSNFNDQKGSFNVLFGKSPKPNDSTAVRLKNTEPGSLHLHGADLQPHERQHRRLHRAAA